MNQGECPPFAVYSLLDSEGVHLIGEYVTADLASRFARLFVATWQRVPDDVRSVILEQLWTPWMEQLPASMAFSPVRLIGDDWPASRQSSAFVGREGLEMAFDGRRFAHEYAPYAAETIAHELAHVYQHAHGRYAELALTHEVESDAERLQAEWGFWFGPASGRASRTHAANAFEATFDAHTLRPKIP